MCICVIFDWFSLKVYWGMKKKNYYIYNVFFLGSLRIISLEIEMGMYFENYSFESVSYYF